MNDYRRILIIKPSSLGDVVHALPTLAAVRGRFPNAEISWLIKRQWAGLLECVEGLDQIWPLPPGLGWLSQVPALRQARFDLVLDLQGLFRSGLMAWLSGCPVRLGLANGREGSPLFYTKRVAVPTMQMHAVDRSLLIAAAIGAEGQSGQVSQLPIRIHEHDHRQIEDLLRSQGLRPGARWVAINPGARWRTKRWPPERFAWVADRLIEEGLQVALIGGPDERLVAQSVQGAMQRQAMDLTGRTPIRLLPALLSNAELLITNDSGPMHVAAAVGTPVVALFGPTSPLRTGPYGSQHQVLQSGLACSPCLSRRCHQPVTQDCLLRIQPEAVLTAVSACGVPLSAATASH